MQGAFKSEKTGQFFVFIIHIYNEWLIRQRAGAVPPVDYIGGSL